MAMHNNVKVLSKQVAKDIEVNKGLHWNETYIKNVKAMETLTTATSEMILLGATYKAGMKLTKKGGGTKTEPKVFTSDDKYVGETATAIESKYPGKVIEVNKKVYKPDGTLLTDYDIILDNKIIQVKKGGGKGATKQAVNTMLSTEKEVIVYLPDQKSTASVVKGTQKEGIKVFTSLDEMMDYLGK